MRTIALAAIAFVALFLTGTDARADGPWCAYYSKGGTNCGFHSYAQCMAAISGAGGSCQPNPSYKRRGRNRDY